jgi:hypothetical protein
MSMKTTKYIILLLMLMVLGGSFYSCKSDDYESRLKELLLKDLSFSSGSGTKSMTLRGEDLSNYEIQKSDSDSATWCKAWIDNTTSTIYVSVDANTTYDTRLADVTLKDFIDGYTRSFKVTQAQLDAIIVEGDTCTAPAEGGDVFIEVKHNINYTVTIPESCNWIKKKASSTRGLTTDSVALTISKNNSGNARSGSITIKNEDGSIYRTVKINQKFTPSYNFEKTEYTVDELSQEISVSYSSNVKFNVSASDSWITVGNQTVTDDSNYVQVLNVSQFTKKKDSRTATVDFLAYVQKAVGDKVTEVKQTLTITQNRTLYIPDDTIKVQYGDSAIVSVNNTGGYSLKWSSDDEKEFTVDTTGQVKCIGNDGDEKAIITVKSKDGKYSDQIMAVVDKPKDLTKYLSCKWDTGSKTTSEGTTYSVGCSISMAQGGPDITLTGYTFYNDKTAVETVTWDGKTLSAKGTISTTDVWIGEKKDYYIEWTYTYMKEKYICKYTMDKTLTITKQPSTSSSR